MRHFLFCLILMLSADPAGAGKKSPRGVRLPAGIKLKPFAPERFAGSYFYQQFSSCSQSWAQSVARASLRLTFGKDSKVTGCRGKGTLFIDPDGNRTTVAQQGFSGKWSQREDGWIAVDLELDDQVCDPLQAFIHKEPMAWKLRCLAISLPADSWKGTGPVLACQFAKSVYVERIGYALRGFLPGTWVYLASGNGLKVSYDHDDSIVTGSIPGQGGGKLNRYFDQGFRMEPSATPIDDAEWTQTFSNTYVSDWLEPALKRALERADKKKEPKTK